MMQPLLRKYLPFILFAAGICCLHLADNRVSRIASGGENARAAYERLGPYGGDVRSLLMDSLNAAVVYLGTSSGQIFKSIDSGKSWTLIYPGLGKRDFVIDTLVQHPAMPQHLYAGAWDLHSDGGGLFESRDGGDTWHDIIVSSRSTAVRDLAICKHYPEKIIVGALNGVFVTENGGKQWTKVGGPDLEKAESVAIDPEDPRFLYVGTWRLSYRSEDFGKTWARSEKGMALDSDVFSLSIDSRDPENIYAGTCGGIYVSANRARSWAHIKYKAGRFAFRTQIVYIDPSNRRRLYAGTTEGLYVTEDRGASWRLLTAKSIVINAIQVHPHDGDKIILGTESQGILRSDDGGRSWQESNAGFINRRVSQVVPDPLNNGRILANVGTGQKGIYSFDEKQDRWLPPDGEISPEVQVLSIAFLPGNQGSLAGTSRGIYWRGPASKTWVQLEGLIRRRIVYDLAVDVRHSVVLAGTDRGIYRSAFTPLDFQLPPDSRLGPTAWSLLNIAEDSGIFYSGTTLGVLRSLDQGRTWKVISAYGLPERVTLKSLAASPANPRHLFAGTAAGLYESTDGGVEWRRVQDERLGIDISCVVFLDASGSRILAAGGSSGGTFLSNDGGSQWEWLYSPRHNSPINHLMPDPRQASIVYLGTRDDGVYRLTLPGALSQSKRSGSAESAP